MREHWDCIACRICRELGEGAENLQELLDQNDALYLEMDSVHRFIFPDKSILFFEEDGTFSYVNFQLEDFNIPQVRKPEPKSEEKPTGEAKDSWFSRFRKSKVGIGLAIGGLLVSGAAVAGVMYVNRH